VREEEAFRSVLVRKMRDDQAPELEPFVIDSVTLGHEDGERITAGVAMAVELCALSSNDPRRDQAKKMRAAGDSLRVIARSFGVGLTTAHRWLA
jgi:hypothetical protein